MNALFLVCALSLPSAIPHFGPAASQEEVAYYQPRAHAARATHYAAPTWNFGKHDVRVIQLLRDWPNGHTASRPSGWVLIYGKHPLWAMKLREANVKVVMMFRQWLRWPGTIQGDPLKTPFVDKQFQVYIYDWMPEKPWQLVQEASRIVAPFGFFLYRFTQNGEMKNALMFSGWERFALDFHEFTIWWRPKNYTHIELTTSVILRSSA